jgi:DNA primase
MAELNHVLKNVDKKVQDQRKEEMAHEQQLKEMEIQQRTSEKQMEVDADLRKEELKNRTTLLAAEIKASGYGAMQDINEKIRVDTTKRTNNSIRG